MKYKRYDFNQVEKSYENFVAAYFCNNPNIFFAFCQSIEDKKLLNKYADQLNRENKKTEENNNES